MFTLGNWKVDTRRAASAILAALVSLAIIMPLFLVSYSKWNSVGHGGRSMSVMSLSKAAASPEKPIRQLAAVNDNTAIPRDAQIVESDAAAHLETKSESKSCTIPSQLSSAVQSDPAAAEAIATMPPELKSLSDAIMLWNGQWTHAADPAMPNPILPIRQIVMREIEASPSTCQSAVVTGPIFIAIPNREHTTTLVFGSGIWRWSDLLQPDVTQPDVTTSIPSVMR